MTTMADALTPTAWRRSAVSRTTLDVVLVLAGSGLVALAVLPLVWRLLGRDAPWADDSSG